MLVACLLVIAPPPSAVDVAPDSSPTSADIGNSEPSASKEEVCIILESLIRTHLKNDSGWEPSGRYHANLPPVSRYHANVPPVSFYTDKSLLTF